MQARFVYIHRISKMQEKQTKTQKHKVVYTEFPEFGLKRIKFGSRNWVVLKRLVDGGIVLKEQYEQLKNAGLTNRKVNSAFYNQQGVRNEQCWLRKRNEWSLVNAITDYISAGNMEAAERIVEISNGVVDAIKDERKHSALVCAIALFQIRTKDYLGAKRLLKRLTADCPDDFHAYVLLAECSVKTDLYFEGIKLLELAVEKGYDSSRKSAKYSIWHRDLNKEQQAEFCLSLELCGEHYNWMQ